MTNTETTEPEQTEPEQAQGGGAGDPEQRAGHALLHLEGFLTAAALSAEAAVTKMDGDTVTLSITGPDAHLLIGAQGDTLQKLDMLLMQMVNKGREARLRINTDADGYRARREQTLMKFAQTLAEQVMGSGQEAVTDPLNPMERRIVHTALLDHPDVITYSEGDDPYRFVVVSPRPPESAR